MSTRCTIKLFDSGVQLYRHCDGYPDGVLPDIQETFDKHGQHIRLNDGEYGALRFVEAHLAVTHPFAETGYGLQPVGKLNEDLDYVYWLTAEDGKPVVYWQKANRNQYPTKSSIKFEVVMAEKVK